MPRSARQKSSGKHGSSRDTRDCSDSEKESGFKDRKGSGGRDETSGNGLNSVRVSKDIGGSIDKRKLMDSKESKEYGSRNGEYYERHSSKRRKEKVDDGEEDRWNGGGVGDDERVDEVKKSGKERDRGESKSKKREECVSGENDELGKKGSNGKSEWRHKELSGRKEGRDIGERDKDRDREKDKDRDREKEKKGKDGRSGKCVDEDSRSGKANFEKADSNSTDLLLSPESENQVDKKLKKRRDVPDYDNPVDIVDEFDDRDVSLTDDPRSGRVHDAKHKTNYRDDLERDSKHRDGKRSRSTRDHSNSRSDDRYYRDARDGSDSRQKKSKYHENERDRDCDYRDSDEDYDRNSERRKRDHLRDYDNDPDLDLDRNRDADRDWDWDDQDRKHERDRSRDKSRVTDNGYFESRSTRSKDDRVKKKPADDFDDYASSKYQNSKRNSNETTKQPGVCLVEDGDRERHSSVQALTDASAISSKLGANNSRGSQEEGRNIRSEESHFRSDDTEERTKANSSREAANVTDLPDKVSKYRHAEKHSELDDEHYRELSQEGPAGSKASPVSLADRSPSLSLERRRGSRSSRRSHENGESGRRVSSSACSRDYTHSEERANRDTERPHLDDSSPGSPRHRATQSHAGLIPTPYVGSGEEESRLNSARLRRVSDHSRGQGNSWRGPWPSPMPNGFMHFQHGPPHAGFQPMMPQFPSLFGVRPSLDISQPGMSYHMPDAERFSGHFRPIGWPNVMDGSAPSHLWEGSGEMHHFGAQDWDQNRNSMNGRGWDPLADMWKAQNGELSMEMSPVSLKEDHQTLPYGDAASNSGQARRSNQRFEEEYSQQYPVDADKRSVDAPMGDSAEFPPKSGNDVAHDQSEESSKDAPFCLPYLAKLDISPQLACPKLYRRIMELTRVDSNGSDEEGNKFLVSLKDGTTSVYSNVASMLRPSLFPSCNDSVFKRAMDCYQKQKGGLSVQEGHGHVAENVEDAGRPLDANGVDADTMVDAAEEKGSAGGVKEETREETGGASSDSDAPNSGNDGERAKCLDDEKVEIGSLGVCAEAKIECCVASDGCLAAKLSESESVFLSRIHQ